MQGGERMNAILTVLVLWLILSAIVFVGILVFQFDIFGDIIAPLLLILMHALLMPIVLPILLCDELLNWVGNKLNDWHVKTGTSA